jgi:hypothetical protein
MKMMENLKPWDGHDKHGNYSYPAEDIVAWNMMIDDNGSVYYIPHDGANKIQVWCPASQLTSHLHRLEQIKAR